MKTLLIYIATLLVPLMATAQYKCETSTETNGNAVEAVMSYPEGFSFSVTDKRLSRLGDAAAIKLIRMGAPSSLDSPTKIRKALYAMKTSFECSACIVEPENKSPKVTLLLLELLRTKIDDQQLKKEIVETSQSVTQEARASMP